MISTRSDLSRQVIELPDADYHRRATTVETKGYLDRLADREDTRRSPRIRLESRRFHCTYLVFYTQCTQVFEMFTPAVSYLVGVLFLVDTRLPSCIPN